MSDALALLTHRLEGDGETILFLNGGFMTLASWEPIADPFRQSFSLLFCDLRGQPLSPGTSHSELEGNMQDVVNLLDHLGIDRVHILGTSFGGFVGLQLAATLPERVHSFIAVTTTDMATEQIVRGVENLRSAVERILQGDDPGQFHDLLVEEVYSPEFVSAHRDEFAVRREQTKKIPTSWFAGLEGIINCTVSVDLRSLLGRVRCPTLVIHAARDMVISRDRSLALATGIAGAEFVEHPTSGHALVAEDPGWVAERCSGFLHRVGVKQPAME